jgi:hypothetical protein
MKSSAWSTSALMWTYDGWGGWYDHVPPPRVDSRGYGFRVPALLVSPYAKKGAVNHTVLDYTAMLHFIETNWNLKPLSIRDRQSAGLASAFDFTAPPRPGVLLPRTWPAPTVRAAVDSPTPVIYGVYGLAAALAIAVVSLAIRWRGPITVPGLVGRGAILVRSGVELTRDRMQRFLPATRYSLRPLASWVAARRTKDRSHGLARSPDWHPAILTIPPRSQPAAAKLSAPMVAGTTTDADKLGSRNGHAEASAAIAVIRQQRAESNEIPVPTIDDRQVSVAQSVSHVAAEADMAGVTEIQAGTAATISPPAEVELATEAEPAAETEEPATAIEPAAETEEPATAIEPAAETEEPATEAEAELPVAFETYAPPVDVRHQRRHLSRSERRKLGRH